MSKVLIGFSLSVNFPEFSGYKAYNYENSSGKKIVFVEVREGKTGYMLSNKEELSSNGYKLLSKGEIDKEGNYVPFTDGKLGGYGTYTGGA